jgi:hypothetical protein
MPRRSLKSREPGDVRQTAVRLREADHQWLLAEAKKHAASLNSEIIWRLLQSREQSVGVNLTTIVESLVPRLEPYLVGANERDANNEVMLAARAMADVLAPLLAAGAIKGEAATQAATAINRLNLARYNLECILGENKVLVPGDASWQAAAPKGKMPEVEEHGVPEPGAQT